MSRLIIHAGTHKTGTTTIQKSLASRRGKLRETGLWYPGYENISRKTHYAHIGVANGLAGDHHDITPALAERFFREVAEQAKAYPVTLLSAESLYRQVLSETAPQRFRKRDNYWKARHAFIAHLRSLVGDAEIVLVFRRQADFAESIYQEHVKVTRYAQDFTTYLDEFWFHFQYNQQYRAWAEHFSKVHVLRFEDLAAANITKRFLLALGIDGVRVPPTEARNVGLAVDWVIYKRWLNETPLARETLQRLVPAMAQAPAVREDAGGRRRFFASADERRAFQARFDEGNRKLVDSAGLDVPRLFDPIGDEEAAWGDMLDLGDRARMTAQLIEALAVARPWGEAATDDEEPAEQPADEAGDDEGEAEGAAPPAEPV